MGQDEKNTIVAHFQQLKAKMNAFRAVQKKRLALLTVDARTTKKTLKGKMELAQRILTLAELARKLESEQEKVRACMRPCVHSCLRPFVCA